MGKNRGLVGLVALFSLWGCDWRGLEAETRDPRVLVKDRVKVGGQIKIAVPNVARWIAAQSPNWERREQGVLKKTTPLGELPYMKEIQFLEVVSPQKRLELVATGAVELAADVLGVCCDRLVEENVALRIIPEPFAGMTSVSYQHVVARKLMDLWPREDGLIDFEAAWLAQ